MSATESADLASIFALNQALTLRRHEPDHKPQFHGGLVIKHNVNQRYATNAVSAALFKCAHKMRPGHATVAFSLGADG